MLITFIILEDVIIDIARPLGLHYNHYVSSSVHYQLVTMLIIYEPHGIFCLHYAYKNAFQHYLTTGMCNILFDGRGFAEHQSNRSWSVSENAHNS